MSILFLAGCGSDQTLSIDVQQIQFVDYQAQIPTIYQTYDQTNAVDQRVAGRIVSLYTVPTYSGYADTIVIARDRVSPNFSLEDYVQASIGGVFDTWKNYTSL